MTQLPLGTVVDEVESDVERGKKREFDRATQTEDAVHIDRSAAHAAGFDAIPATPTHTVVAGHYRSQIGFVEKLGLALVRVVVGSVKWQYVRPLAAGDSLRGTRRVVEDEQRERKRGGTMRVITLETEYVDRERKEGMRPPVHVAVGESHPSREIGPVTQTDIVRFAGAGGDFNPLHHDIEFVKTSGFQASSPWARCRPVCSPAGCPIGSASSTCVSMKSDSSRRQSSVTV